MIRNLAFFLGLIILTFWIIFRNQDINELLNILRSVNKGYVLLGVLLMLVYYLIESYNIRRILIALNDKKISIFNALKFTLIGFFFSAITPASTGGQPIEGYYMTKEKISGANAALALLIQLCGFQISTLSIGLICALINPKLLSNGLIWFFILGFTINGIALTIMLICVFSKRLTEKLTNLVIKLLNKFNVKDLDVKTKRINGLVEKYNSSSVFIKTHQTEFIKVILRVFVQIIIYYSIPLCVYKAFGLNSLSLFEVFTMQAVLYTTVSGLPLPGSIGVSETIFLRIFGVAFGETLLGSAMLLSRGISFYLFVIISLIVVIINALIKKNIDGEINS